MRRWRVVITGEDGFSQAARLEAISMQRVILNGTYALPVSANCRVQILIPKLGPDETNRISEVSGVVESAVFSADLVRLTFKMGKLPAELRQMIDRYGMDAMYHLYAARYETV